MESNVLNKCYEIVNKLRERTLDLLYLKRFES